MIEGAATLFLQVDTTKANLAIQELRTALQTIPNIQLKAQTGEAAQQLKTLNSELSNLSRTTGATSAAQGKSIDSVKRKFEELGVATRASAGHQLHWNKAANDAHAVARGLSGSVGALWLTYGSLAPLLAGAALGAGFSRAAKDGAEFAYQLTFVKALGGETAESIRGISTAALDLSKNSLFGPVELANGLRILSQAGLTAKQSIAALPSTLQLATVGEMSMEAAALTLVGVMNAFNLALSDLPHIGDTFAKAAALSQTSVAGMTEAMKQASVVHDQYGASIDDTAAALTLLAKVNITGTRAGTSYRNMLKDLYTPSVEAGNVIAQLGLKTKDANGELRAAPDILFDLQDILKQFNKGSQTDILGKLFSERGGKEAIAILGQTRESWNKLKDSISNSDGFMAQVTAELEQTVKGRFKQALNTMTSNIIDAFDKSEGSVRELADSLKDLADSPAFLSGIQAIVGGIASLANILVIATPALIRFVEAWAIFKTISLTITGIEAAGVAFTGLSTALRIVGSVSAFAGGGLAGLRLGLAATTSAAGVAAGATGLGALGGAIALLTNPITWVIGAIGGITYALNEFVFNMPKAVQAAEEFGDVLRRQNDKTRESIKLLQDKNRAQREGSTGDADAAAAALDTISKNLSEARSKRDDPNTGFLDRFKATREVERYQKAELEAVKQLGVAERQQFQLNAEGLVSVIQDTNERVSKLREDAAHQGKKLNTEQIDSVLAAYSGQALDPKATRALRDQLERLTGDLSKDLIGAGTKVFVPEKKTKPSSGSGRLSQEEKDAKTILKDTLSSKLKQEQIILSTQLLDLDVKVAAQQLSSVDATEQKNAATLAELNTERDLIKSYIEKAQALGFAVEKEKFINDLAENSEKLRKQEAQSLLDMTKARTADSNALDNIALSTSRYLEDLGREREELGKTTLEVTRLRIERERLRAVEDIKIQENRKEITPVVANAQIAAEEQKAAAKKADEEYRASFVGGWQKATDEYIKTTDDAATTAADLFKKATTSMEDALVELTLTGKLSFKSLADSIIGDIVRMSSKMLVSDLFKMIGFGGNPLVAQANSAPGDALENLFKLLPNAKGNVFNSSSLSNYSNNVYNTPKVFAFAKGAGVFGEAGPEAIMPLTRDAKGRLGVRASNDGQMQAKDSGHTVIVNIHGNNTAADVRRAGGQLGREVLTALSGAKRYG